MHIQKNDTTISYVNSLYLMFSQNDTKITTALATNLVRLGVHVRRT
ncbi:hypothetical protein HDC91_002033 [Mucilaginibacter sp. AK015]|nr:hypothetical protein [Mucilaginibacter sp. AK015]